MMAKAMANPGFRAKIAQAEKRVKNASTAARGGAKPRGVRNGKARSNGQGTVYHGSTSLGAAVSSRLRRVGMSDVIGHTISWLIGYTWVGDGATVGEANSLYLIDPTQTYVTILGTGIGSNTAIAAADAIWGASYCADVLKHYARIRIRKQFVDLQSLVPSTANSCTVVIAGQRGASGIGTASASDNKAGSTYTNVVSMSGATQVASWESCRVDMTDMIAGGSGAAQNEFDVNAGFNSASVQGNNSYTARGVVPSSFAISGANSASGLEGKRVHAVIGTWVVDLLDFIGGQSAPYPEGDFRKGPTSAIREGRLRPPRLCREVDEKGYPAPSSVAPVKAGPRSKDGEVSRGLRDDYVDVEHANRTPKTETALALIPPRSRSLGQSCTPA